MMSQHHLLKFGNSSTFDSRPEIIGPGWWISLHVLAHTLDGTKLISKSQVKLIFEEYLHDGIGKYFPCLHCRAHALEYITKNKSVLEGSCLEWTRKFHNEVNIRLSKPSHHSFDDLKVFLEDLREGKGCNQCGGTNEVKVSTEPLTRQSLD